MVGTCKPDANGSLITVRILASLEVFLVVSAERLLTIDETVELM